jgi:prepilin-type N-terminal cleavage/methylation domain-containing protein
MNMQRTTTTTKVRRGVTVLELVIVVTMMGILAAFSLGKTSKILEGWRVTRAAQAMSEELQQGFALVGRNRKPIIMKFDTDSMTLFIVDRANVKYRRRNFGPNSEYKLSASNLSFSMLPSGATPHVYALEIYPPGLAADSLSIVITRPSAARRIRMLRGGLVQICSTGAVTKC